MRYLSGKEEEEVMSYLKQAAHIALASTCLRSKCGSVVVKAGRIIGKGWNSPPGDITLESCLKDSLPSDFKSDKTCCIHAEQRAIMDALINNADEIGGSRLYFVRLDENNRMQRAGRPYCTICSKMALDVCIGEFVLWHEAGVCVYDTEEYNKISFGQKAT